MELHLQVGIPEEVRPVFPSKFASSFAAFRCDVVPNPVAELFSPHTPLHRVAVASARQAAPGVWAVVSFPLMAAGSSTLAVLIVVAGSASQHPPLIRMIRSASWAACR